MSLEIPRRQYADLYGPTAGDRVRFADTDLFIEIEKDLTTPGDEAKFGGGKVLRDGMGQSTSATSEVDVLDTVITNAVSVDSLGIRQPFRSAAVEETRCCGAPVPEFEQTEHDQQRCPAAYRSGS